MSNKNPQPISREALLKLFVSNFQQNQNRSNFSISGIFFEEQSRDEDILSNLDENENISDAKVQASSKSMSDCKNSNSNNTNSNSDQNTIARFKKPEKQKHPQPLLESVYSSQEFHETLTKFQEIKETLNPQQKAAVESSQPQVVIYAGPG